MADPARQSLERCFQSVKAGLLSVLAHPLMEDLAFIGNASDIYPWEPCRIVDLDVCLFCRERNREVGSCLASVRDRLTLELSAQGVDFELRLIRGSYKHAALAIERPVVVAHVSLFTEALYAARPPLLRWAWRKYVSAVEPLRLTRLKPERPTFKELLYGRAGVAQKLATIEGGTVPFVEYFLPELNEVKWTAGASDPLFAEYCLAAGLTCARNHARVLDKPEPDRLPNGDFVDWYERELMCSPDLRKLMVLKQSVRERGYAGALVTAPALAIGYLRQLFDWLRQATAEKS